MPATLPTLTDATAWTDADLDALRVAVLTEQERRRTLAIAPALAEQTAAQWRAAQEVALPPLPAGQHRAWVQPTGAHDVYQRGAVVAHGGKVWESAHPANVWAPGGAGVPAGLWKDVTATAPAPAPTLTPTAAEWKAGEALKVGDLRTYKGTVYKVIQAHTSAAHWTPDAVPSLYAKA